MFLSEVLAVGSAVCIALSSMFVSELNGRVPLLTLARLQVTAAFIMTSVIATALHGWETLGFREVQLLALSGIFGIAIASSTYFATIYAVGPRLTALLFSLTSPFAFAMAYLAFGETIGITQGFGILLILSGILVAIVVRRRLPPAMIPLADGEPTPSKTEGVMSRIGIVLGVITAAGQALGSLLARPAMAAGVEAFAAMSVRLGIAVVFFWFLLVIPRFRLEAGRPETRDLMTVVISAFFGTAMGMSLLMGALQTGNVGIVSTLSSMTPIVILPMVWIRSGRAPSLAAWGGAFLAVAGITVMSVGL